jgi:hypothetical protein
MKIINMGLQSLSKSDSAIANFILKIIGEKNLHLGIVPDMILQKLNP